MSGSWWDNNNAHMWRSATTNRIVIEEWMPPASSVTAYNPPHCRYCGSTYSSEGTHSGATCPHCGAPRPRGNA